MKFFNFDKIKEAANCLDIAKEIGLQVDGSGRTSATWRGGDNQTAVSISATGWHDFVTEESGSVIDLVALVKFDGDRQQAQSWLGDRLRLDPEFVPVQNLPGTSHYDKLIDKGYREAARYNYMDEVGNIAHYVVRMEHPTEKKQFVQGANGRWGVKGIALYPYNLPAVISSPYCYICEGEKAATALIERGAVATTNASGAGKWQLSYNQYFQGKSIAILRDNDDEGLKHAKQVAKSLFRIAKDVRILATSTAPKGDVFDWFEENSANTLTALFERVNAVPALAESDLDDVAEITEDTETIEAAKLANRYPITNYWTVKKTLPNGSIKIEKQPKQISKIVDEIHRRFLGFPCRISEQLFDHDRDTHEIYPIRNQSQLFSWMARKSKQVVDWKTGDDYSPKSDVFEALHAEAKKFQSISLVPDWPRRNDVYYAHKPLPQPDPDHKYFNQLVDYFNPKTRASKTAIKAFIMAPLFYLPGIPRPLWVIDADRAGSGKTTLANLVANLYGRPPIEVKKKAFAQDMEKVTKRIVSPEGRLSRMLLVDNVTGIFSSEELSGLITMPYVTGMAPYGRGEESRPNNLTYVITANDATIDNDLAIRSYFIDLETIQYNPNWNRDIQRFMADNQLHIFADMLDILNSHNPERFDVAPCTRCPEFEVDILQAVCADMDEYTEVVESIVSSRSRSNVEEEYGNELEDVIRHELLELGINPDTASVWIRSQVISDWAYMAFPDRRGNLMQFVKGLSKAGHAPRIHTKWTAFPKTNSGPIPRRRGVLWLNNQNSTIVETIISKRGKQIETISTGHRSDVEI
jgi:hypothetical protein